MCFVNKAKIVVPSHVAIIMDGNGRWATKRNRPRTDGHKQGVEAIKRIIDSAIKFGIKTLSLFAFSTENWNRDKEEVDYILNLVEEYTGSAIEDFVKKNVRFTTIGNLSKFSEKFQKVLYETIEKTKKCDGLIVNIALNYGGRDDILMAVNSLLEEGRKNVTLQDFELKLQTNGLTNPDLIIRASGEQRLSNFMLFQSAYSELLFPKRLWPDFSEKDLFSAIKAYSKRDRRYGNIKKQEKKK
ncbi:MAG: polyprenyl diphosphate synthase [Clostridia bacterium]